MDKEEGKRIRKLNRLAHFSGNSKLRGIKSYNKVRSHNPSYEYYMKESLANILRVFIKQHEFHNRQLVNELFLSNDLGNFIIASEIVYKETRQLRKRYGFK